MQPQIRTLEQQVSSATTWRFFSPEVSVTVHLNMSERENGRLPLAKLAKHGELGRKSCLLKAGSIPVARSP